MPDKPAPAASVRVRIAGEPELPGEVSPSMVAETHTADTSPVSLPPVAPKSELREPDPARAFAAPEQGAPRGGQSNAGRVTLRGVLLQRWRRRAKGPHWNWALFGFCGTLLVVVLGLRWFAQGNALAQRTPVSVASAVRSARSAPAAPPRAAVSAPAPRPAVAPPPSQPAARPATTAAPEPARPARSTVSPSAAQAHPPTPAKAKTRPKKAKAKAVQSAAPQPSTLQSPAPVPAAPTPAPRTLSDSERAGLAQELP